MSVFRQYIIKKEKKYTFYYDEGKTMSIYNNKERGTPMLEWSF